MELDRVKTSIRGHKGEVLEPHKGCSVGHGCSSLMFTVSDTIQPHCVLRSSMGVTWVHSYLLAESMDRRKKSYKGEGYLSPGFRSLETCRVQSSESDCAGCVHCVKVQLKAGLPFTLKSRVNTACQAMGPNCGAPTESTDAVCTAPSASAERLNKVHTPHLQL